MKLADRFYSRGAPGGKLKMTLGLPVYVPPSNPIRDGPRIELRYREGLDGRW